MKLREKPSILPKNSKKDTAGLFVKRSYYFHPDEDFREDTEWGKNADEEQSGSFSTMKTNLVKNIV